MFGQTQPEITIVYWYDTTRCKDARTVVRRARQENATHSSMGVLPYSSAGTLRAYTNNKTAALGLCVHYITYIENGGRVEGRPSRLTWFRLANGWCTSIGAAVPTTSPFSSALAVHTWTNRRRHRDDCHHWTERVRVYRTTYLDHNP